MPKSLSPLTGLASPTGRWLAVSAADGSGRLREESDRQLFTPLFEWASIGGFYRQGRQTKLGIVFIEEISLAPVGAIVGDVGVDPGDNPDVFLPSDVPLAGIFAKLC